MKNSECTSHLRRVNKSKLSSPTAFTVDFSSPTIYFCSASSGVFPGASTSCGVASSTGSGDTADAIVQCSWPQLGYGSVRLRTTVRFRSDPSYLHGPMTTAYASFGSLTIGEVRVGARNVCDLIEEEARSHAEAAAEGKLEVIKSYLLLRSCITLSPSGDGGTCECRGLGAISLFLTMFEFSSFMF